MLVSSYPYFTFVPDPTAHIFLLFQEQTKTTKAYKGVHFSKYASKRMDFGGRNGPGPGEYEPYKEPTAQVEHANIVEKKKVESKLPRYHEWVVQTEEKKAVPGPGKYQVPGTFDPKPTKVNTEGIEVEHPPFGSQAKVRFIPVLFNPFIPVVA